MKIKIEIEGNIYSYTMKKNKKNNANSFKVGEDILVSDDGKIWFKRKFLGYKLNHFICIDRHYENFICFEKFIEYRKYAKPTFINVLEQIC